MLVIDSCYGFRGGAFAGKHCERAVICLRDLTTPSTHFNEELPPQTASETDLQPMIAYDPVSNPTLVVVLMIFVADITPPRYALRGALWSLIRFQLFWSSSAHERSWRSSYSPSQTDFRVMHEVVFATYRYSWSFLHLACWDPLVCSKQTRGLSAEFCFEVRFRADFSLSRFDHHHKLKSFKDRNAVRPRFVSNLWSPTRISNPSLEYSGRKGSFTQVITIEKVKHALLVGNVDVLVIFTTKSLWLTDEVSKTDFSALDWIIPKPATVDENSNLTGFCQFSGVRHANVQLGSSSPYMAFLFFLSHLAGLLFISRVDAGNPSFFHIRKAFDYEGLSGALHVLVSRTKFCSWIDLFSPQRKISALINGFRWLLWLFPGSYSAILRPITIGFWSSLAFERPPPWRAGCLINSDYLKFVHTLMVYKWPLSTSDMLASRRPRSRDASILPFRGGDSDHLVHLWFASVDNLGMPIIEICIFTFLRGLPPAGLERLEVFYSSLASLFARLLSCDSNRRCLDRGFLPASKCVIGGKELETASSLRLALRYAIRDCLGRLRIDCYFQFGGRYVRNQRHFSNVFIPLAALFGFYSASLRSKCYSKVARCTTPLGSSDPREFGVAGRSLAYSAGFVSAWGWSRLIMTVVVMAVRPWRARDFGGSSLSECDSTYVANLLFRRGGSPVGLQIKMVN
ncbi:hypothetical protein FNV43_RR19378 [Rhamnella rubrinervis]|uniref:Uncharacterized protein n=1 Tax=Rhamnella rubrinervis TaxID=2594499 RepID=A0A8K0E0Q7_9ROSA|nr:hypothetical protein FNV43_RR19378 [Rhamnella rubrinervis]